MKTIQNFATKRRVAWLICAALAIGGIAYAASTRTNITWQIYQGGAYEVELNLDATALYPETDGGVNLGSDAKSFDNGWIETDFNIGGALTAATFTGSIVNTSQEFLISAGGKPGATKGWVTTGTAVNLFNYTLPASTATTATMVIPVAGLKVGWTITAWKLIGQIESAGGTVELDGDLRKITTVAAGNSDASVGAIAGINVVADTAINDAKTGLTEVVAATESFYVLLSGTTAGSTDIDIQGVTITVTTN